MADPKAVVEQLIAAINAHDRARWRPLFAADCRCVTATSRVLDVDALEQVFLRNLVGFPDLRVEVERWVVHGDTVVTEEVMAGTHQGPFGGMAATGRQVRIRMVHITRVAGERIVERVAYQDSASLLRQMEDALPS
jgi:predicted ester cyclase